MATHGNFQAATQTNAIEAEWLERLSELSDVRPADGRAPGAGDDHRLDLGIATSTRSSGTRRTAALSAFTSGLSTDKIATPSRFSTSTILPTQASLGVHGKKNI